MRYDFGDCEFDAERCELRCAGQSVQVEPKVFKVLAHLITHRNRVVHKDELLERFWPGTFISESALTQCLTKVRKAVQDDNVSQRIIKTVRGHGYRFVADVTVYTSSPATAQREANPPASLSLPSPPCLAPPPSQTSRAVVPGERKQVTVLVAGLKGVTELAQWVDAEVLYELLQRAATVMRQEVEGLEGYVTHCTDERLVALFGAPVAQEDHVMRALHAALGIQRAFANYANNLQNARDMRIGLGLGVHTGTVVIGELEHAEVYYRQALSRADTLGMRPLQAHCYFDLGSLYARSGHQSQAQVALSTAMMHYRTLDMRFWFSQAEAALHRLS